MVKRLSYSGRNRLALILGAVAIIVCLAGVSGKIFYDYASEQVYEESIAQLDELAAQLFEKLDVQLEIQWNLLQKFQENCLTNDLTTQASLCQEIAHSEKDLSPYGQTFMLRAIDKDGYYYTETGKQGIWTGFDQIDDDDDDDDDGRQSFLIADWLDTNTYMAFVLKCSSPLLIDGREITHFVLLRPIQDMQPYFHSSAFGEQNLVYIVDINGTVLFEDGAIEGLTFEGKNVFHSLSQLTCTHGDSFESFVEYCNKNGRACTEVASGSQTYYVVYDRMPAYDWGMLFLVSSDEVASSTVSMVNSMLMVFVLVVFALLMLLAVVVSVFMRFQNNRKLLKVKIENEEALEKSNRLLEHTNEQLQISQHKIEEALDAANRATKAKSNFLANMSHDIRTPMNAIVGITELMEGDLDDREKMPAYIRKLKTSSNYMLGLINDILDMSKIESGEVSLNLEPLKMAEQAGQIESIIRSQSNEREQDFSMIVHEVAHEYLIGDSIRVRQIFINLLNNAVKYTQSGGKIRFEIREVPCALPGHATIVTSVIDNGYGMTAEYLEHLFEPFTREESSLTNKVQGTGLGMSITKNLVDLMDGTITVQSEPNKGTRFDVTLTMPIDKEAYEAEIVQSVVLVTTEETLANNMRAAFKEACIDLRVAASPENAVALLNERMADAVLLSGYLDNDKLTHAVNLLRAIVKDDTLIFCCDYAHRKHVRQMLKNSGVDGFIPRPFFLENLAVAVKNARGEITSGDDDMRTPLSGKRFLCAEDNELNAEILEALLAMHNATCDIYPNGVELVRAFESVHPGDYDAILMDVQMPKMDGMEATHHIRNSKNTLGRTIPIIAMTANAFSSDVQECLDAGMDAHLAKPVDIAALERTLHEILSRKSGGGATFSELKRR